VQIVAHFLLISAKCAGNCASSRRPNRPRLYTPREKFWRFEAPEYPDLVPPLLIYADLLATADDRNIETARKLYDERLAELIETD
jgi:hypothetical protein